MIAEDFFNIEEYKFNEDVYEIMLCGTILTPFLLWLAMCLYDKKINHIEKHRNIELIERRLHRFT